MKLNTNKQDVMENLSPEMSTLNLCYKEQLHVLKERFKGTVK